jgi:hypothetical protein
MSLQNGVMGIFYLRRGNLAKAYFSPAVEAKCLLVNPSIVRGLWDYERRQLMMVFIQDLLSVIDSVFFNSKIVVETAYPRCPS